VKERTVKVSTVINLHKALVAPVVISLMLIYNNWSVEAFIYLALHGTYSLLWLLKQALYPDRRFDQRQPLWIAIVFIFVPLAGYYLAPFLLISQQVTLSPVVIAFVLFLYIIGIFLHYVGDAQKYYTLRYHQGLIQDGLFSKTRNPNYLGEILIYVSFASLSWHWLPFMVLGGWVFSFFLKNMRAKDRSLARYPGFEQYRESTGLLFPKLF
jgi:protein-S-isoprenylcysteine O-methyltransferase Ste14